LPLDADDRGDRRGCRDEPAAPGGHGGGRALAGRPTLRDDRRGRARSKPRARLALRDDAAHAKPNGSVEDDALAARRALLRVIFDFEKLGWPELTVEVTLNEPGDGATRRIHA